eukprot:gene10811-3930_t
MPSRRKRKGKKGAGGAAGGGGAGQPAEATPLFGASAASAEAAAESLNEKIVARTVTPQSVAAAAAALATLGNPSATSSISFAHWSLGDTRSAAEYSAKAADAAVRFPDALPPYTAARCFNQHAERLAAAGRVADAAGWVARAHPLWLRSASDPGFRDHLLTACGLRFRAGHAAKAVGTLKRAAGNSALDAPEGAREWAGAAATAEPALRTPPSRVNGHVIELAAIHASAGPAGSAAARHALAGWRAAPDLAAGTVLRAHGSAVRLQVGKVLAALSKGDDAIDAYASKSARVGLDLPPG